MTAVLSEDGARGGLGSAGEVEPDDASDDDADTQQLLPRQLLGEEYRAEDDNSDAGQRGPQRIADTDVEGQQGQTEEEGGDSAADEGGNALPKVGEALCFSGGDAYCDFEDDSDSEVEPTHGKCPFKGVQER
ncbi:hypothetical protein [Corynebacterium sanguinis]|uniref:hypothetical protein n=1 Tax=Corynebacterium sanguinis TaxID=2594913 RepID=UPI004057537B